MATHSIGTGGDFSTPQLWEDDIPSPMTENRIGQLKNQEFSASGPTLEFSDHTPSGFLITLECETGASFKDNANVRTNALRYNASNGAGIKATTNFQPLRINGVVNLLVRNVQFANTGSTYENQCLRCRAASAGSTVTIKDCIFEISTSTVDCCSTSGAALNMYNCLMINRGTSGRGFFADPSATVNLIECTIVRPSNITAASTGVQRDYGTVNVTDCAIFGFSTDASGLASASDYNATSKSDAASGLPDNTPDHNVYSVTYDTTLFVQPSDAGGSHDFRLVAGNGLENAGLYDGTNTPNDISGTARANPPEIGVWELASTPSGNPRAGDMFSPMTGF